MAISVHSDDEWEALKVAIGEPGWVNRAEYATSAGRYDDHDQLDAGLSEWTSDRDRFAVARHLQAHGVRAGVVQDARDRLNWDRQMAHRGTYAIYDHAEVGPRRHETLAATLSRDPYVQTSAAPLLGGDNDYVFRTLLGLDDDALAALEEADAIRTLVRND